MSGTKPSAAPPSPLCTLRRAVLSLATLAFVSLTILSSRSLTPPPAPASSASLSIPGADSAGSVYHDPAGFRRGYEEMERRLRVFVYPDGDPKTFYQTPRKLTGKYASEGYFFQNIRESPLRTLDPDRADLFFIPISCHKMRGKNFGSRSDTVFCGVFDGHGPYGHMVAKRVRDSLPLKLIARWKINVNQDDNLRMDSCSVGGSMNYEDSCLVYTEEESRTSIDIEDEERSSEIFTSLKESFLKAFKLMDRELRIHWNAFERQVYRSDVDSVNIGFVVSVPLPTAGTAPFLS